MNKPTGLLKTVLSKLLTLISLHWISLTILLLFTITFLSLSPSSQLPSVPGSDKTHHFLAYAALMLPSALRKPRHLWLLILIFIAYSGGVELLQPLVNRYAEWSDWAANIIGVMIGAVIGVRLNRCFIASKTGLKNP